MWDPKMYLHILYIYIVRGTRWETPHNLNIIRHKSVFLAYTQHTQNKELFRDEQ